ncbi:MAG: UDP-glucose 4-epimerase GalE [Microbacterium sp.]|nr:UDP-glucose 4-epimerase GalE [Microbacterium sp.]MBN9192803.1 UDP-glucose 4-epimerase GalE [Microbacterium sp.]
MCLVEGWSQVGEGESVRALITGGAGYIGSTVAAACLDSGIDVVVLDSLATGHREFALGDAFYEGDFADTRLLDRIYDEHPDISVVVHCAADIVVPDSVADPLGYYDNNVAKTIAMVRHLRGRGAVRVVFSSSASIYLAEDGSGVDESAPIVPGSPYAATKAMVERILADAAHAGQLRAIALRYFNPIGAEPRMRTGLQTHTPSHVLGRLISAWRSGEPFTVTGTDWPTRDGSGLRDFIHVWDLARAHVDAIRRFDVVTGDGHPYRAINVGAGTGTTVRELVAAFAAVVGEAPQVVDGPRRPGDSAGGYAVVDAAWTLLGWRAELDVAQGIRDSLAWSDRFAAMDLDAAR